MADYSAVIIGGSAGSFAVLGQILAGIRTDFPLPIIICVHRQKQAGNSFCEGINCKSALPVVEPTDKEQIVPGKVYLAPANYHMFVEMDGTFSLSTEAPANFCRPAIDHTLVSAASFYRQRCVGIILTGANKDGAIGIKAISDRGGYTIVQDPATATIATMPNAALRLITPNEVLPPQKILEFLNKL